jgi:hypothetical protein
MILVMSQLCEDPTKGLIFLSSLHYETWGTQYMTISHGTYVRRHTTGNAYRVLRTIHTCAVSVTLTHLKNVGDQFKLHWPGVVRDACDNQGFIWP